MFGYITVNKEELKVKDFERYHSYYCGICRDLKQSCGELARMTLTYDMTFLAILLTGLYEEKSSQERHFCVLHPMQKRPCTRNRYTSYAADMNILLVYHNLMDDWQDEKKRGKPGCGPAAEEVLSEDCVALSAAGQSDPPLFKRTSQGGRGTRGGY